MTARQLELQPPVTRRGEVLLAVSLPVEPQAFVRPQAQGRIRYVNGRPTAYAHHYDDDGYTNWKKTAAAHLAAYLRERELDPIAVPFIASVVHVFERPQIPVRQYIVDGTSYRYPWPWTDARMPRLGSQDLDNLNKAVMDAAKWAQAIADDKLWVEDGGSRKVYAAAGEDPCVEVRLWRA